MPRIVMTLAACATALGVAGGSSALAAGSSVPSLSQPLPGSDRLPNGWGLHPAGRQVLTTRATTGVWVSPDGRTAYATTSGIFDEAVVHVDGTTLQPTPTLVSDTYQGVLADTLGNVWVSGGPADAVWQFKAAGPALIDARQAGAAPDTPNRGIPATGYPGNMLLAGSELLVAGNLSVPSSVVAAAGGGTCPTGSAICSVVNTVDVSNPDATSPAVHAIPVGRDAYGLAYRRASSTLYVTNWADQTNPARSGGLGTGTVSVVKLNADGTGSETQVVPVGKGPTGLALSRDGSTLVVADSDTDQVSVLAVDPSTGRLTPRQTLSVAPAPGGPLGAAPVAVSMSPDGRYVYVALAGLDAVEVFRLSHGVLSPIAQKVAASFDGRTVRRVAVPASYIPTGWYPDALALGPRPSGTGQRLFVANLRGEGAGPGYYGQTEPLVGSSTEGSLSVIDLPSAGAAWRRALTRWTGQVVSNDQLAPLYDRSLKDPASDACLPAPLPNGGAASSALLCRAQQGKLAARSLHVVIIESENKTFDAYFGDTAGKLSNATADPAYTEYGNAVTTNQHNLAYTYSVNDNFWNEGAESSVLGHSWLSGAYTTVDRELTWGMDYAENLRGQRSNGQYGTTPLSLSGPSSSAVNAQEQQMLDPRTLLIDRAYDAGLSVRLLGTDIGPGSPVAAAGDQVPQNLWGEGGSGVSSDLAWPDVDRAAMFLDGRTISHAWDTFDGPPPANFGKQISFSPADYQKFSLGAWTAAYAGCAHAGGSDASCQHSMPNLLYMQLPENHTYDLSNAFNPLDPTPQSMVADNDYAIGKIIEGLSHSPFWKNTIVFMTEDDNQFTGDHVDIHRTFLLTAGGMARQLGAQGRAASQTGSFPSVDKTTEVLLGLKPMTLFDARAVPLQQAVADTTGASTAPYSAVYPPTPFLAGRTDNPVSGQPALPGLPAVPAVPPVPGQPVVPGQPSLPGVP
jgi:DNA-binding beta-propeller fold protein YncE